MRTCILTGASRGIGQAIAVKLSKRDDIKNFALIARSTEGLNRTKEMMDPEKNILLYNIDITDDEEVQKVVKEVGNTFGGIDILINSAGYADPKSLLETTVKNWETTFKVNVGSVFLITREVVKYIKKNGGKIINIASTAGSTSRPGWAAYAASKAAVISLSKTLSDELKEYGIKVYCVSPGRCATDLRRILAPEEDPTTIMQPEDVAEFVDNLVSSAGDFLDGQDIVVRKQMR